LANGTKPNPEETFSTSAYGRVLEVSEILEMDWAQAGPDEFYAWLSKHTDVGLTERPLCASTVVGKSCSAIFQESFSVVPEMNIGEQTKEAKLIGVVDGAAANGETFLEAIFSSSVPVRATLYRSWYDSRIVPWAHYVPMDNDFIGLFPILEFFFGSEGQIREGAVRGKIAEDIAHAGAEWARRVLRKEDMEVYMFRLLLEYARILEGGRWETANPTGASILPHAGFDLQ